MYYRPSKEDNVEEHHRRMQRSSAEMQLAKLKTVNVSKFTVEELTLIMNPGGSFPNHEWSTSIYQRIADLYAREVKTA